MIARADGNYAAGALGFGKLQKLVAGPAFLKTAGHLQVFELAEDLRATEVRQGHGVGAGRMVDGVADALAGGANEVERDFHGVSSGSSHQYRARTPVGG